jgi:outer membrane protein assembly factor BamA
MLKAAVFLDAGNIWTLRQEDSRPGGAFHLNQFYRQLAAGTGLGLRYDFSYFILRTDFGIPLHDPSKRCR